MTNTKRKRSKKEGTPDQRPSKKVKVEQKKKPLLPNEVRTYTKTPVGTYNMAHRVHQYMLKHELYENNQESIKTQAEHDKRIEILQKATKSFNNIDYNRFVFVMKYTSDLPINTIRTVYKDEVKDIYAVMKEGDVKDEKDPFKKEYMQQVKKRTVCMANLPSMIQAQDVYAFSKQFGKVEMIATSILATEHQQELDHLPSHPFYEYEPTLNKSVYIVFCDRKGSKALLSAYQSGPDHHETIIGESKVPLHAFYYQSSLLDQFSNDKHKQFLNLKIRESDEAASYYDSVVENIRNRPNEEGWVRAVPGKGKKFGQTTRAPVESYRRRKLREKRERQASIMKNISFYGFEQEAKQREEVSSIKEAFNKATKAIDTMRDANQFHFEDNL